MFDCAAHIKPNATPQERALHAALSRGRPDLERLSWLMSPEACPSELLGWLAWSLSVDVWRDTWPDQIKRQVLRQSIAVHRRKGTLGSVKRALGAMGFEISVSEWFDFGGAPHTFRLDAYHADMSAAGLILDARTIDRIRKYIIDVKPVRSHFDLRVGALLSDFVAFRAGARARYACRGNIDARPEGYRSHTRLGQWSRVRPRLLSQKALVLRPVAHTAKIGTTAQVLSAQRLRNKTSAAHGLQMPTITARLESRASLHLPARLTNVSRADQTLIERSA